MNIFILIAYVKYVTILQSVHDEETDNVVTTGDNDNHLTII